MVQKNRRPMHDWRHCATGLHAHKSPARTPLYRHQLVSVSGCSVCHKALLTLFHAVAVVYGHVGRNLAGAGAHRSTSSPESWFVILAPVSPLAHPLPFLQGNMHRSHVGTRCNTPCGAVDRAVQMSFVPKSRHSAHSSINSCVAHKKRRKTPCQRIPPSPLDGWQTLGLCTCGCGLLYDVVG